MKLGKRLLVCGFLAGTALLFIETEAPRAAFAQQKGKQGTSSFKKESDYLAIFRDAVAQASKSTVRVLCDASDTALGVVITADGFILTEAYDLKGKITIKLSGGQELEAKWVGHHEAHGLAMLKIDAQGLTPIVWSDSTKAPVGHFVASAGTSSEPVALGVVSVAAREMPAPKDGGKKGGKGGFDPNAPNLGLTTVDDPKGAKVSQLNKGGKGGFGGKGGGGGGGFGKGGNPPTAPKVKVDDIIVALGDKDIKNSESFTKELQKYKIGDEITLRLLRGEEELELKMKLPQPQKKQDQNQMGSVLSKRITGFPVILQHDSVVLPTDCGGPLVDLEGHVIGINISRAGRVESYAIPSETIRPLLLDLMSGKLPHK
jgi:serine protease Do